MKKSLENGSISSYANSSKWITDAMKVLGKNTVKFARDKATI